MCQDLYSAPSTKIFFFFFLKIKIPGGAPSLQLDCAPHLRPRTKNLSVRPKTRRQIPTFDREPLAGASEPLFSAAPRKPARATPFRCRNGRAALLVADSFLTAKQGDHSNARDARAEPRAGRLPGHRLAGAGSAARAFGRGRRCDGRPVRCEQPVVRIRPPSPADPPDENVRVLCGAASQSGCPSSADAAAALLVFVAPLPIC